MPSTDRHLFTKLELQYVKGGVTTANHWQSASLYPLCFLGLPTCTPFWDHIDMACPDVHSCEFYLL